MTEPLTADIDWTASNIAVDDRAAYLAEMFTKAQAQIAEATPEQVTAALVLLRRSDGDFGMEAAGYPLAVVGLALECVARFMVDMGRVEELKQSFIDLASGLQAELEATFKAPPEG